MNKVLRRCPVIPQEQEPFSCEQFTLPELVGGKVAKKSVRLADILATLDQIAGEHGHLDAYRWN